MGLEALLHDQVNARAPSVANPMDSLTAIVQVDTDTLGEMSQASLSAVADVGRRYPEHR